MFNRILCGTVSSRGKEAIRQLSNRVLSKPLATPFLQTRTIIVRPQHKPITRNELPLTKSPFNALFITNTRGFLSDSTDRTEVDWLEYSIFIIPIALAFILTSIAYAAYQSDKENLPRIVNVGNPILHQPAREVHPEEIWSKHVRQTIDDMVKAMRRERVASLSAPQIGVPIKIIVLEDTKLYMAPSPNEVNEKQDRHPSDLLVIVNPKLRITNHQTTQFLEGCVSVTGHLAMVKRFLAVEVTGLDRNGQPIKVEASGWQARILQHACDHLKGILFVDKLVKRH